MSVFFRPTGPQFWGTYRWTDVFRRTGFKQWWFQSGHFDFFEFFFATWSGNGDDKQLAWKEKYNKRNGCRKIIDSHQGRSILWCSSILSHNWCSINNCIFFLAKWVQLRVGLPAPQRYISDYFLNTFVIIILHEFTYSTP